MKALLCADQLASAELLSDPPSPIIVHRRRPVFGSVGVARSITWVQMHQLMDEHRNPRRGQQQPHTQTTDAGGIFIFLTVGLPLTATCRPTQTS